MNDAISSQRTALVTGGARRIGREIALALARDGWDIAVHYHGSKDAALATALEIQALGRRAQAFAFDLAGSGEPAKLLAACEAALGPVRCIVNNASRFDYDSAADFSVAAFEEHMRTNVVAPVRLAWALHAQLEAARANAPGTSDAWEPGVVVNLLDQKLWNPNPDFFSYTLSKAALETATGLLARALAPVVRVVGLAPGITLAARGQSPTEFAAAHRATPLGQSSTPEDLARGAVYLARARAVTGTTLLVDGGQHLVPTARDIMFLKT